MTIEIPLTQGQVALIDDWNFERVSQHSWCAEKQRRGNYYAVSRINGQTVKLHRFIMDAPDRKEVDHKDRNTLNCQEYNLRFATHAENGKNMGKHSDNRSGFKGITYDKDRKKYKTQIMVDGVQYQRGRFDDPIEAARTYDAAACKYHGEFASLNFPDEWMWLPSESRWQKVELEEV